MASKPSIFAIYKKCPDISGACGLVPHQPVKQRFVQRAVDWPYSTFHRYVGQGIYPLDWAGGPDFDVQGGERG